MKTPQFDQSTLNCVKNSLATALENGYSFEGYTTEDIAGDLIAYDDTFGIWSVEALTPYVSEALSLPPWHGKTL